jgi:hypothetical protein
MYQQFLDQTQQFFKPLKDLLELNHSALETLASKQSALVTQMMNESFAYATKVAEDKQGNYLELQQAYLQGLNQRLTEASQHTADYFAATQAKVSDLFQETLLGSSLVEATKFMPSVQSAVASAVVPTQTAKPVAAGAAKVPAAKAPSKVAAPKAAAVKPSSAKPAAPAKPAAVPAKKAASSPVAKAPEPVASKAVVDAAEKSAKPEKLAAVKQEASVSKKVGGDDASVEKAIRSIMAERN